MSPSRSHTDTHDRIRRGFASKDYDEFAAAADELERVLADLQRLEEALREARMYVATSAEAVGADVEVLARVDAALAAVRKDADA